MTKIGLLGDTHGNRGFTQAALRIFHYNGVSKVIQLGDFGISNTQYGQHFLKAVRLAAQNYGITLYVVPGNHEDYDFIESIPVEDDGWQHLRNGILLAPRGLRWTWEDTSFVALGGAPSVDRAWRLKDSRKIWWPQEAITEEDVENVLSGGYADVMVAHDAPHCSTIDARISGNPQGFEQVDLDYAEEGRKLMDRAFHGVAPKLFFHGHYHFPVNDTVGVMRDGERKPCYIVGLDCDGKSQSLALYDTESGFVELLSFYEELQKTV